MDPITHLMTGACLARTGFNRKAAYATVAMTLAAEAPDLDVLWSIKGPIAAFQHHRGWTHTFLGIPFEAAIVVGVFWLFHRWRSRRPKPGKPPRAPIRWGLLYCFSLIALLSHLFLDWTNNYGLRPFFPFNTHWYAGSFVFIFEPVLFLILIIALVAPSLFGLIGSEVGARAPAFRGRGWAIASLLAMAALLTLRYVEHGKALRLAEVAFEAATIETSDLRNTVPSRVAADPYPINPFRWQTVVETPQYYQISTADTFSNTTPAMTRANIIYKPPTTLATLVAKQTWLGEVYLDWSQYPVVADTGTDPDGITTVTFTDLRFLYNPPILSSDQKSPLSGAVYVNSDRQVVRMEMDGHVQH